MVVRDNFCSQPFPINYKVLGHKLHTPHPGQMGQYLQAPYFENRAFRAFSSPHTPRPSVSLRQLSMAPAARMKSLLTEWFSSWTQSITSQCSWTMTATTKLSLTLLPGNRENTPCATQRSLECSILVKLLRQNHPGASTLVPVGCQTLCSPANQGETALPTAE